MGRMRLGFAKEGRRSAGYAIPRSFEPRSILAVELFDMTNVPGAEKRKHRRDKQPVLTLEPQRRLFDLLQEEQMRGAMFVDGGESVLFKQPFFAGKVQTRVLDQTSQVAAYLFPSLAVNQRNAKSLRASMRTPCWSSIAFTPIEHA